MNNIAKLFRIDAENHELMGAQLAAFSRQVPLLYFILSVNSIALAFTHLGIAPTSLTVAFPGFLVGACAIRCLIWLRRRDGVVDPEAAARTLQATVLLGGALGFAFRRGRSVCFHMATPRATATSCSSSASPSSAASSV